MKIVNKSSLNKEFRIDAKTPVCIVDIDTTIADNEHRVPYLADGWEVFLDPVFVSKDTPHNHVRDVLNHMRRMGHQIIFLTGRSANLSDVTGMWLKDHVNWDSHCEPLVMRTNGDRKPASQYKENALNEIKDEYLLYDNTFLFFEDDQHVLEVWKQHGVVFKCPEAWASMNPERPKELELDRSR